METLIFLGILIGLAAGIFGTIFFTKTATRNNCTTSRLFCLNK